MYHVNGQDRLSSGRNLNSSSLSSLSAMSLSAVMGSFIFNLLKCEILPDMHLGALHYDASLITRMTDVCGNSVSETGFG